MPSKSTKISKIYRSKKAHKKCGNFERYLNDRCCVFCSKNKSKNQYLNHEVTQDRVSQRYEKEAAIKNKDIKYESTTACSVCKLKKPKRYSSNRNCVSCAKQKSNSYNQTIKKIKKKLSDLGHEFCSHSLYQFYCMSRKSDVTLKEWKEEEMDNFNVLKYMENIKDKDTVKYLNDLYLSNKKKITLIAKGNYEQAKFKQKYARSIDNHSDINNLSVEGKLNKWYQELKSIAEKNPFNRKAQIDFIIAKASCHTEDLTRDELNVYLDVPLTPDYYK